LTLTSATATATQGDTATGSFTLRFTSDTYSVFNSPHTQGDTVNIRYACDAPSGASCPAIQGFQSATADTANITAVGDRTATWVSFSDLSGWQDTAIVGANISARSTVSIKAVNFAKVGTYTYTLTGYGKSGTAITGLSATWTVTVTAPNVSGASIASSYFAPTNALAQYGRYSGAAGAQAGVPGASIDSYTIVAPAGTVASPALAAVLYVVPANSAGDTAVTVAGVRRPVQDTITVTITGGSVSNDSGATKNTSTTMNVTAAAYSGYTTESVSVYSNGTAGVATITLTNAAGTRVLTKTVTFTGAAASAGISLSDTYTYIGGTLNLNAQVKDSGGNLLGSGTLYVLSSDTKVVSAGANLYSSAATSYSSVGACSSWTTTTLSCSLTTADTGTASIYLADSWNVTAASFVTTALTLTVTGNTVASATVAFDKATYGPGERAVITITTKDVAGRLHATGATGTFTRIDQTPILTGVTTLPYRGTSSTDATSSTSLTEYLDTGVETRVVTMPTFGTDVTYSVVVPGFGVNVAPTTVTATAKVVDPSQTAQNTAIANAQAAADAATDAALQAIDAANAATDAANLAAEAADAATVAAQESKDAADAATAAVESLATQVATLMAALQAQITSLANVVAKIAKKVKA